MKINFDSVASVAMKTESLGDTLKQSVLETRSPLNASFSPVSGIDHVGSIHQRVLETDPSSASNSLNSFVSQLDWLYDSLAREVPSGYS